MKILPILLLLLSFNANAFTPESCLEMFRSQLLLLEVGALESAEQVEDRYLMPCSVYNYAGDADREFYELHTRVQQMGLIN